MPVRAMPAYFFAHSEMDGRGGFSGRGMVSGRVRKRAGLLSVSVAVLMVAKCAVLRAFGKGGSGTSLLAPFQGAVFFYCLFRWCRSLRDLNHRLISVKPPA